MSNPFLTKIEEISRKIVSEEAMMLLGKELEAKIEAAVEALVPLEVSRQLHKALAGEELDGDRGGGIRV